MTAHEPTGRVSLDALLAHRDWVRALARSLVADPNRADDVEQETWRMALERPPRHAGALRAWFAAVVRNAVRKSGRHEAQHLRLAASAPGPRDVPSPADVIAQADVHARLVRAVLELDEPYASTVLYRYFHGLAASQIAARLGVPVETVRTRLRRAIERLRARMGVAIGDDRDAWCLLVLGRRLGPAGGPSGAALTGAAGATAMGALSKTAVAACLLVGAIAAWTLTQPTNTAGRMTAASSTASVKPARAPRPTVDSPPRADVVSDLPPPVDLDRCDRDLDLHGVVVRRDGSPVAGASVATVSYPWRRASRLNAAAYDDVALGPSTKTAIDGTFALRLARGACVSLRVTAAGLASVERTLRQAGERVRVVLEEGVRLRIATTDETGAPLAGIPLQLFNQPGRPTNVRSDAKTDASGIALVDGLPADERVFIKSLARDRAQIAWQTVDLPATGEAKTTIVLPAGVTLRGRVVDAATGAAVSGARVGVNRTEGLALSREDGTFELPGLSGKGTESVDVVAEGYARASTAVGSQASLDFALRRGFVLTGRVVSTDGAPVAAALVAATATPFENSGASCFSAGFATSAADGRFRITSLDRELTHGLCVTATDRGRACSLVTPAAADVDVGVVVLPAPRAIEGRVLDASGKPVADVAVTASGPLGADSEGHVWRSDERSTDDLGRFRFHDLAPGRYSVFATVAGAPRITTTVEVPADRDVLDVTLAVTASRTLTVRVVDDAGKPVRAAVVQTNGRNGSFFAQAETDGDGVVRMSVDAAAMYVAAYPAHGIPRDFLRCETQELRPDQTESTFVFHDGAAVVGRVVDPDGKPLRHALVRVRREGGPEQVVSTDDDGRFRAIVPRGATCSVAFDGIVMGRDTDLSGAVAVALPGVDVVVRADRTASNQTLRVRVVDPDGHPLAGVFVSLVASSVEAPHALHTDADGRAKFDGLRAREFTVGTSSFGEWYAAAPRTVAAGGAEVVLALRRAPAIRGTVVREGGAGTKAVVVVSSRDPTFLVSDVTSDDGAFAIRVPPDDPGPFRVTARLPESAPGTEAAAVDAVAPGAKDVRIVLPR